MREPLKIVGQRLIQLSRDEISQLLQACHWIAAAKGTGVQREVIADLAQVGALKKSRTHFSGREPRKNLQRVEQQSDGTWILAFDNGIRQWTHTWSPPVRK